MGIGPVSKGLLKAFASPCSDNSRSSKEKWGVTNVVLEPESDMPGPVLIEGGLPTGSGRNKSLGNGKLTAEDF